VTVGSVAGVLVKSVHSEPGGPVWLGFAPGRLDVVPVRTWGRGPRARELSVRLIFLLLSPLYLVPSFRRWASEPGERAAGRPRSVPLAALAGAWLAQRDDWVSVTLRHHDGSMVAYHAVGDAGEALRGAFGALLGPRLVRH
jgi:hypothetical protein